MTAAFALSALSALAVAPLAPFLLESLRLSRAQVGLFLPAVYLGGVLMALPAGWLTDLLGVRKTLALGQALTGVMVALVALTGSLPLMLCCLVLAGFGFSVANPATGRAIVEWFPARERGMAMDGPHGGRYPRLPAVAADRASPGLARRLHRGGPALARLRRRRHGLLSPAVAGCRPRS